MKLKLSVRGKWDMLRDCNILFNMLTISRHENLKPLSMQFRLFTNSVDDSKYYKLGPNNT